MTPSLRRAAVGLLSILSLTAVPGSAPRLSQPYDVYNVRVRVNGESTQVVLETTGDVQYRDVFASDAERLTVDLLDARLATPVAGALIARGGVREIELRQTADAVVRLVVHFENVDDYAIFEQGNDLVIAVENEAEPFPEYDMALGHGATRPVTPPAPPEATAVIPAAATVARDVRPRAEVPEAPTGGFDEDGLPEIDGAPITVDFQDADIETVIRSFAEFGGVSIVAGAQVTGTITATIRATARRRWPQRSRKAISCSRLRWAASRATWRGRSW